MDKISSAVRRPSRLRSVRAYLLGILALTLIRFSETLAALVRQQATTRELSLSQLRLGGARIAAKLESGLQRHGNFSHSGDRFTVRSPEFFADAYRLTPTVLELEHYGKVKELGNWDGRAGSNAAMFGKGKNGPAYFRGALQLLHASFIGYHGNYAHEWLEDNPEFTREMLNRCGYWLFPKSIELPESMVAGATMLLTLRMENRGVAPPYAPYELRVKLSGAGTNLVRLMATGCKSWLPGAPVVSRYELALPADLKAGSYEVGLGLFYVNQGKTRAVDCQAHLEMLERTGKNSHKSYTRPCGMS